MMKTKYLITVLFLMIASIAFSQSVPSGMNYQAIAHNRSGELLTNKTITLKINLQSQLTGSPTIFYSEIHRVTTNEFGLFSMIIGKGSTLSGNFNQIPWSTDHIWMEVSMKEESDILFSVVNSTEMMAVPYAFHAGSASHLSGSYIPYVLPSTTSSTNTTMATGPVPASSWQVTGNSVTNPPLEYLGTSDLKDFVIKTNAIERMRVYSTGNIYMNNSLAIGRDLIVGHDATFNHDLRVKNDAIIDSNLTVGKNANFNSFGGSTINYGPFKVDKMYPSILTGSLRVDKVTNLNDSLNVNNVRPTLLTGTLRVNKATNLYSSFVVNSQAPSIMTGTLRVDSDVIFKNHLTLDNPNYNSFDSLSGAFVVTGGAGINRNLNIGGNAKISGNTALNGQVKLTDERISERPDSGALIVTGGVGIGKQISVGKFTHLYDSLRVDGAAIIQNALTVADSVQLKNKLIVTGLTTFNGGLKANGQVTIESPNLNTADQSNYSSYPLQVQGGSQGVAIKVTGSKSLSNNYYSFWDPTGMQGRIEGMAAGQYNQTTEWQEENRRLNKLIEFAQLNVATATLNEAAAIIQVVAAATSSTGCAGLGFCVTAPIPSLIVSSIVNAASATVLLVRNGIDLDNANTAKSNFDLMSLTKEGVTYESGAGDYAEYLPMLNQNEKFYAGDIVGLKGGKITKNTVGADKIMIISKNPIVLGNMPKNGNDEAYKKVAFLGQVPVQVFGKVNLGDYILPDGNFLGIGIAVAPDQIKSADVKKIAGIAWSASDKSVGISTINVAVGLNVNDNQRIVDNLRNVVQDLKKQIAETDATLKQLVPGYKATNAQTINTGSMQTSKQQSNQYNFNVPNPQTIIYHDFRREEVVLAFDLALNKIDDSNNKNIDKLFLNKLKSDPTLRESTIDKLYTKIVNTMSAQKELDNKLAK